MEHKIFVALSGAVLVALLIVGCSSAAPTATTVPPKATVASPTTAPTATTARPAGAPAQPTAAPTTVAPKTAAAPSANHNGEWKGNTSSDSPFSLIVENNQLTFFNLNYGGAAGRCQSIGHKVSV